MKLRFSYRFLVITLLFAISSADTYNNEIKVCFPQNAVLNSERDRSLIRVLPKTLDTVDSEGTYTQE